MEPKKKVKVRLIGADGNVFNLLGICVTALKRAGEEAAAKELAEKVMVTDSYDSALQIMMTYVDVS